MASFISTKIAIPLFCICLAATACTSNESSTSTNEGSETLPQIVVTTSIWGDVVSNIACDGLANVEVLIPNGADPHTFELSLTDRQLMEDADLLVSNGLSLEEGMVDTLDEISSSGKPIFQFTDHIELLSIDDKDDDHSDESDHKDEEEHEDHSDEIDHSDESDHEDEEDHEDDDHSDESNHEDEEGHDDDHDHSGSDPHVWLSPISVSDSLDELASEIKTNLDLDNSKLDKCVEDYQALITQTDSEIQASVETLPVENRKLITNHDAFSYYAERYGFEAVGVVIPSPSDLAETNPAQLQKLADIINEEEVKAIFAESQHSDDDAQALAREVGNIDVVTLYSGTLGEEGSGADTYIGYLETNTKLIVDALE